jgi:hypothetical protein
MNLSVDSFPYTDEQFAEEMRNCCTQSPADRVLVNVRCRAKVVRHFAETFAEKRMNDYESEKPVMRGALNYVLTNEEFRGKLIQSIAKEMEDKLLEEKRRSCLCCASVRIRVHSLINGICIPSSSSMGVDLVVFPVCFDPLCLIRIKDASSKMGEAMHGKKIIDNRMQPCVCGKVETPSMKFERCSRCQTTFYCSRECQRVDWKILGHKQACRAFVALKNKNA